MAIGPVNPAVAMILAFGLEMTAIILGILAWKSRIGKAAVIVAALVPVLMYAMFMIARMRMGPPETFFDWDDRHRRSAWMPQDMSAVRGRVYCPAAEAWNWWAWVRKAGAFGGLTARRTWDSQSIFIWALTRRKKKELWYFGSLRTPR